MSDVNELLLPRSLIERAIAALTRHMDRHAPMRVPVDNTDSDVVRSELQAHLAQPEAAEPDAYSDGEILARLDALGDILNQPKYLARLEVQRQFYPRKPKAAQPAAAPVTQYDYTRTFNAIAAAARIEGTALAISCAKFWEVYGAAPVAAHALAEEELAEWREQVTEAIEFGFIDEELANKVDVALRGEPRG